jgi:hypothetical protein
MARAAGPVEPFFDDPDHLVTNRDWDDPASSGDALKQCRLSSVEAQ